MRQLKSLLMSALQDWLPAKDGRVPEKPGPGDPQPPDRRAPPPGSRRRFPLWYFVILAGIFTLFNLFAPRSPAQFLDFTAFADKVRSKEIKRVQIGPDLILGFPARLEDTAKAPGRRGPLGLGPRPPAVADSGKVYRTTPVPQAEERLVKLLDSAGAQYYAVAQSGGPLRNLLFNWILPAVFFLGLWMLIMPRMGGGGAGLFALGKSRAHIVAEGEVGVTFEDVAGVDEAKEELKEIIDFLKSPGKYLAIGGKVPKGILLIGPPGTGKTLLARAVAGEAKVPFFRISGSDFVEMIVGVGAARVRDLFKQAREKAPCIVFIDELDAIGKSRSNLMGGHDEREQTLNQLLVEMDGFDPHAGVIVLAATNRPEILDSALLRPGRFDRHVVVDKPDLAGREAILRRHARDVKLDPSVDMPALARKTPGFAGADLANIINEGALIAVRLGRDKVTQADLDEAVEKVMAGLKKKTRVMQPKEKERVAYHETGHALVATFTPGSDPVEKVSIIPRGLGALGFTWQLPTEERYLMTEGEILARIDVLLGGRAAEELVFGEASTGAANDLGRATELARQMIMDHGMNDRFRNVVLRSGRPNPMMQQLPEGVAPREISEATQQYIDEKIAEVMRQRYSQVTQLLQEERGRLTAVAQRLLEKESLSEKEFKEILSRTPAGGVEVSGAP